MTAQEPRPWIHNDVCINDGTSICDLGYTCDGCPFYSPTHENEVREKET